jgi:hypothetical protein
MMGTPYPKEQMHRIAYTKLSERQIADKLSTVAVSGPTSASPLSDVFAGKSIRIVTDKGPALAYTFGRANRLSVVENGGGALEAGYGALALSSVAFFSHMIPGTERGYAVVLDQDTNLATVFELWFSGYQDNREVQREIYYGYVEQAGQQAPTRRWSSIPRLRTRTLSSCRGWVVSSDSAGRPTTSRSTTTCLSIPARNASSPAPSRPT